MLKAMKMKKLGKKGVIDQLVPLVTSLVVVGVVLVVAFLIMAEVKISSPLSMCLVF